MAKYVLCVLERSMYSSSVGWTCNVYLLGSHVLKWDPKACVHQCCVCCESAAVGSYPTSLPRFSIQVCYQKTKSGYIRRVSWEVLPGSKSSCQLCFKAFSTTLGVGPGTELLPPVATQQSPVGRNCDCPVFVLTAPVPKRQKCDHWSPCPPDTYAYRLLSGGGLDKYAKICFEDEM